jgi:hypothetical protein
MKTRSLLVLLALALPLSGCPKKQNPDDAGVEQAEGSSSADKSGEGTTDEMQEKKGNDAAPADAPADAPAEDKK